MVAAWLPKMRREQGHESADNLCRVNANRDGHFAKLDEIKPARPSLVLTNPSGMAANSCRKLLLRQPCLIPKLN